MAATIVDAFMVTLGLDGRGFTAGQKAATKSIKETSAEAKKAASEIEERGKAAAAFLSKLRNEALALVAVFTAGVGIKNFVTDTIGGAASLGLMAKNLDMTTESLSAWQKANERAGGSAESIVAQLKESAQELANIKMGRSSEAATEFYRMGGVDARNFKDGNEFLLARSRILADMYKQDPTRAMVVAGRMGISEDTFNLLKQGPEAVMALVNAQRKNSQVTEEQAAQALKLRNAWLDFRDRIATVTTQIVLKLEPALTRIMDKLQSLADWVASHQDQISEWLESTIATLTKFATEVDGAAQSVGGWKTVLAGLLALKLVGFTASLLGLAGSLTGVAGGLGLISSLGPAALAVLAGVGVYAGAKYAEPTADEGPLKAGEKVGKKTDNSIGPREIWLRTLASTGDARAAKELYQLIGRNDYPATWTPEKGKTEKPPVRYKRGEGGISEMIDRTLASLGNINAGIRIKNATGIDDYNVGDAKLDDKPKARTGVAGGRALMDLPRTGAATPAADAATNGSPWQIPPGVQVERDRERLRILQEELSRATSEKDRAALMREIQRTQSSISTGSGNIQPNTTTRDYLRNVGPGGSQRASTANNTSTTEVNISNLTVNAPGADVGSISGGLADALRAKMMAAKSNTGLD